MKISKLRVLISTIMTLVMAISTWQVARAWVSAGTWSSNTQYYRFNSTVPTGYRGSINSGANAWTNVTPSHWSWNYSTTQGAWIYYQQIDGPDFVLGQTTRTFFLGHIVSTYTIYDSWENWYTGTGVPGSNQWDLRSAAAHEFGHGVGLSHTSGIYCPGNTNNATLCVSFLKGSYYTRTLEGDDRNGVNTLYP